MWNRIYKLSVGMWKLIPTCYHRNKGEQENIMAYSSTPYVGMTLKKMAATLKVHKWHTRNVCVRLVKGLHEPYRMLPLATGPLLLLESITEVPDRQVTKTSKSSIFWLSFLHHDSTTTVITTIQTWKNSTNHWVLYSLLIVIVKLKLFCSDSQAFQC